MLMTARFAGLVHTIALISSGALVHAQEAVRGMPTYEQLQQGPWQAREWSGRDFAFTHYPWNRNPLDRPAEARLAREYEVQKLLTPLWNDRNYIYPFEIGEWDWGLHNFAVEHADVLDWLQTQDRKTAYHWLQTYYRTRLKYQRPNRDKPVLSFAGHYNLNHYGSIGGADMVGHEIGENIIGTQSKIAFLRGAARQFGLPTFIDVSQWYANYGHWARGEPGSASTVPFYIVGLDETVPPDAEQIAMAKRYREDGYPNGAHSASWMARAWYMSWLAGANILVPEASQNYFFSYNPAVSDQYVDYSGGAFVPKDPDQRAVLSPAGERARRFMEVVTRNPQRGIPYTPFAILLDQYSGFNGSQVGDMAGFAGEAERTCPPRPFGVLEPTFGDREIYLFFDAIWPGSMYLDMLIGRSHDQNDEHRRLVASPYGDSFDVLLSNASLDVLASYPVIICLGYQEFTPDTLARLTAYLEQGGRLVLTHVHADQLGSGLATLKRAGHVETFGLRPDEIPADLDVTRWYQPFLPKADEAEILRRLERLKLTPFEIKFTEEVDRLMTGLYPRYMPLRVSGTVEFLVNRTPDGWLVGLINHEGAIKEAFAPIQIDPSKTQIVEVELTAGVLTHATELCMDGELPRHGNRVTIEVPPGEVRIVQLTSDGEAY